MRVHLVFEVEEDLSKSFEKSLPDCDVSYGELPAEDTEILVAGRPTANMEAGMPNLKAVVIPFAGLIPVTREALLKRPGLDVYNLHHNASATAEKAIELMMSAAKRTVVNDRSMRQGVWAPRFDTSEALQLAGKTALVLGYGEIGRRVAAVCVALGMDVTSVRRSTGNRRDGEIQVRDQSMFPVLATTADVLLVCAPLTDETKGIVSREVLKSMPRGGIVVNIGRGPIIDEEALFDCLKNGHLHGAGLDVWWKYPTGEEPSQPSDFPFQDLDNVVMSPHNGGTVQGTEPVRMAALSDVICRIAVSDTELRPVDVLRGY